MHTPLLFTRDIDLENPEEWKAMKFYWEVILGRIAGCKGWEDGDKHYTTISRAVFPHENDGNKKLFDVSTEAFALLSWENNYQRWNEQLKWLAQHPNAIKIPQRVKANKHWAIFKSLYTDQDKGQQKYGGWSKQGIIRFNKIYDDLLHAKHEDPKKPTFENIKADWHEMEEAILEKLRDELGIEALNKEGEKKRRKGKGTPAEAEPIEEVTARGMDFD